VKRHDPLLKLQFLTSLAQIKGVSGVTSRVAIILTNAYNFEKDKCWWSIKTIAKTVKSSEKQVSTAIKFFKENKIFFICSGRTGKSNEYKPNFNLILQYPAYASEETLQKIRKKTTDQTIKENNKLNTNLDNNHLEERSGISKITDPDYKLKSDARLVKKGIHTQRISQVDVQEMLKRGWITEQEFKNYG